MRRLEIHEFLKQYPEFDNENYRIVSCDTQSYGGVHNIVVHKMIDNEWQFYQRYWCGMSIINNEIVYEFEEEKFVRYNTIRISIDDSDLVYGAHYDYDESDYQIDYGDDEMNCIFGSTDYTKIENNVVEVWRKDNEQKVREEIARKILSGEIGVSFYCSDSDSWDAPLSKIDKIYKV